MTSGDCRDPGYSRSCRRISGAGDCYTNQHGTDYQDMMADILASSAKEYRDRRKAGVDPTSDHRSRIGLVKIQQNLTVIVPSAGVSPLGKPVLWKLPGNP